MVLLALIFKALASADSIWFLRDTSREHEPHATGYRDGRTRKERDQRDEVSIFPNLRSKRRQRLKPRHPSARVFQCRRRATRPFLPPTQQLLPPKLPLNN